MGCTCEMLPLGNLLLVLLIDDGRYDDKHDVDEVNDDETWFRKQNTSRLVPLMLISAQRLLNTLKKKPYASKLTDGSDECDFLFVKHAECPIGCSNIENDVT